MKRPFWKNKGRYLLLGLAAYGAYQWWHEPAQGAEGTPVPVVQTAPGCVQVDPFEAAPTPPSALTGRLGLWVARIDPVTLKPLKAVAQDPDGIYPLASSYKQAVLWALLRAVDAGSVQLSERFDVTLGNQSLGNYPFDGSDVKVLATRMIHNSDNTATDILHRRVGLQEVQNVADELNLCRTRLILPTKNWWVAQAGLDPTWPGAHAFDGLDVKARLDLANSLDATTQMIRADVLQVNLDEYFEERYDERNDFGTHNISTPYEFAQLMTHQFLKPGLSAPSEQLLREVMATGYGRGALHVPVAYFGGKGGNGWKILTMTGYFETPNGEHVVYTFMQHGSHEDYTIPNIRTAFRWINAAVGEVLSDPVTSNAER